MASKRSSEAHAGAKEVKILSFDPEDLVIVGIDDKADGDADLADARATEEIPEEFILNLMHYGVLEDIRVKKNAKTGKTEVVDGRKRTLGLREANKRLKKKGDETWRIDAKPWRGASAETIGVMISTNAHRFEESPLGPAKKAARMLERGASEEDVALAIGKSVATVRNLISYIDAPAVVRNATESGKISISDAYKLSRLEVGEAKKKVEALIKHAPRVPGKKRSKNAAKARAIVDAGKKGKKGKKTAKSTPSSSASTSKDVFDETRAPNVVENVLRELQERDLTEAGGGALTKGAIVALQWVLGDDAALKSLGL